MWCPQQISNFVALVRTIAGKIIIQNHFQQDDNNSFFIKILQSIVSFVFIRREVQIVKITFHPCNMFFLKPIYNILKPLMYLERHYNYVLSCAINCYEFKYS